MPRFRGGRGGRGFRGGSRGRRGFYQGGPRRGQHANSPASHSVPASTQYPHPNPPIPPPGAVPIQSDTINVDQQASPAPTGPGVAAQSNIGFSQPGNYGDPNLEGVGVFPSQDNALGGAQNTPTGNIPSLMQPLKPIQQEHLEHVDGFPPETFRMQQNQATSVDLDSQNQSNSVPVDDPGGEQGPHDGSTSPVDLYLYGPDYKSDETESVLGKRKDPPVSEADSVGIDGGGGGEEGEDGASGGEQKDGKKKVKVG